MVNTPGLVPGFRVPAGLTRSVPPTVPVPARVPPALTVTRPAPVADPDPAGFMARNVPALIIVGPA